MSKFPLGSAVRLADLSTDPYPILKRLQAEEPVSWVEELRMWFVTRRADVIAILTDRSTFTTDYPAAPLKDTFGVHMLSTEGEPQARFKRQSFPPFRPDSVTTSAAPWIAKSAHALIDQFAAGSTDLALTFAAPLAIQVIARVLGLPQAEPKVLRSWYDDFSAALANFHRNPTVRARGHETAAVFREHVRDRLEVLRSAPDDSLLSTFIHAPEPGRLTEDEIVSNALLILFGGIETTESVILNAVWALLQHPGAVAEVRADRALLPNAIEESMRWETPVQTCTRHATRTSMFQGVSIAEGDTVQCMLGAANRDPAHFDHPEVFDIRRSNAAEHLSFGYGAHFCLGAALARAEARIGIELLLDRLPGLRLDPQRAAAPQGHEFRKPLSLPVVW